jgi:SOS-response transcriptional repressor LexA
MRYVYCLLPSCDGRNIATTIARVNTDEQCLFLCKGPKLDNTGTRLETFAKKLVGSEHGWQTRFAGRLNVSTSYLRAYLSGRNLPGNVVQKKLRALGCDIEWLMTGQKKDEDEPPTMGIPMNHRIPFLGKVVATPGGKEYFEDFEARGIFVPSAIPGKYFALEVEGVSMMDADPPIYPGDIVIFEKGKQPKSGDIVAVALTDGSKMVKILKHRSADEVELHSANKHLKFPYVTVPKAEIAYFGIYAGMQRWTKDQKHRLGIAP